MPHSPLWTRGVFVLLDFASQRTALPLHHFKIVEKQSSRIQTHKRGRLTLPFHQQEQGTETSYDYQWRLTLDPLYDKFQPWTTGELPHDEMDTAIHKPTKPAKRCTVCSRAGATFLLMSSNSTIIGFRNGWRIIRSQRVHSRLSGKRQGAPLPSTSVIQAPCPNAHGIRRRWSLGGR